MRLIFDRQDIEIAERVLSVLEEARDTDKPREIRIPNGAGGVMSGGYDRSEVGYRLLSQLWGSEMPTMEGRKKVIGVLAGLVAMGLVRKSPKGVKYALTYGGGRPKDILSGHTWEGHDSGPLGEAFSLGVGDGSGHHLLELPEGWRFVEDTVGTSSVMVRRTE